MQDQKDFPMGAEGAGVVMACGTNVTGLEPGQGVACNSASFAEHAVVPARLCTPVPDVTHETAAMALSGVFACGVINGKARVQPGMRVLITAGAGAVQELFELGCIVCRRRVARS